MFVATYWFQSSADGIWHAIREDSSTALCDRVQIKHNLDNTVTHVSQVPAGGTLHDECAAIVAKAERT